MWLYHLCFNVSKKNHTKMKTYITPSMTVVTTLEIGFWGPIRSGQGTGSFTGDDGTTIDLQGTERGTREEWGDLWN